MNSMTDPALEAETKAKAAKAAASRIAGASTDLKNKALLDMAQRLSDSEAEILDANAKDLEAGRQKGLATYFLERLTLNEKRIAAMQEGLRQVAALPDPIGEVIGGMRRPNGLQITKRRVPLGVIGIIFESRPNVTVDAAALCLKSGNTVVLRGGSEAIHSNQALVKVLQQSLVSVGLPSDAIVLIESTDREAARRLMTMNGVVDCLIPRGGAKLIQTVIETASIPVIETGTGNCHIYVQSTADFEMASQIVINAKVQRPSVCNSAETLLVDRQIASTFLPKLGHDLCELGVELRADSEAASFLAHSKAATEEDWYEEYLDKVLAVHIVDDCQSAIDHINKYGSHHSDAIITSDYNAAQLFTDEVDSAAVYVNASTRFTDGFEFGFGAEIGISNQKLHARGPMGLEELTTYKYIVRGNGQVRS